MKPRSFQSCTGGTAQSCELRPMSCLSEETRRLSKISMASKKQARTTFSRTNSSMESRKSLTTTIHRAVSGEHGAALECCTARHTYTIVGDTATCFLNMADILLCSFNGVDSLITADDANHSRQRKLVAHAFADKSLKDLEPMLKTWSGTMQRKLAEQAGKPVDMLKYYNCTTFDISKFFCLSTCP